MPIAIKVSPYDSEEQLLSSLASGLEGAIEDAVEKASQEGEVLDVSVMPAVCSSTDYDDNREYRNVERGYMIMVKIRTVATPA
jgi:hypothetical protein